MKKKPFKKHQLNKNAVQYKHDLGQHFLYDEELLQSLISKAQINGNDNVLEIGAGAGTLTRVLCKTAAKVVSVEVDDALMPFLRALENEYSNLKVIQSDIRKVNLLDLGMGEEFVVAANLPYSITSQILDLFFGKRIPVKQMSVMVQKEVADKIVATPGDKAYGLMSVRCRYYCIPSIIQEVPAAAFTPPPKVDSAFVQLTFRKEAPMPVKDEGLLWRMVKASYKQRRKTLVNAMKAISDIPSDELRLILKEMELNDTIRGEVLSIEQWIALANAVYARIH